MINKNIIENIDGIKKYLTNQNIDLDDLINAFSFIDDNDLFVCIIQKMVELNLDIIKIIELTKQIYIYIGIDDCNKFKEYLIFIISNSAYFEKQNIGDIIFSFDNSIIMLQLLKEIIKQNFITVEILNLIIFNIIYLKKLNYTDTDVVLNINDLVNIIKDKEELEIIKILKDKLETKETEYIFNKEVIRLKYDK